SNSAGTVAPSDLAVFRFTLNVSLVDCSTGSSPGETIFILTTNAAARRIGEMARDHKGTQEELDRMAKSTLADAQFAPEVLSRIDNVFAFREMQGLDIARIVALEIENKTREYGLEIAEGGID